MNKLSHSSTTCFQDCPKKYYYRYIEKLYRPVTTGALLFGTALDHAVEVFLRTSSKEEAYKAFNIKWDRQDIVGESVELSKSTKIIYAASDYDDELLDNGDWYDLYRLIDKDGTPRMEEIRYECATQYSNIVKQKAVIGFDLLKKENKEFLNYANWLSLRHKGHLMLECFITEVSPNIEKVLGTQLEVKLSNEVGDEIIGYADFVVKWKGIDTPIILDLKTSTRNYEKDAVLTSPQLSLYLNALSDQYGNTRKAGYIVLYKMVQKNRVKICSKCGFDGSTTRHKTCNNEKTGTRCGAEWLESINPSIKYDILIDDIPKRYEEMVLENFEMINLCIKNNIFTRSLTSCDDYFGCDYKEYCIGGDCSKLIKYERVR